MPTCWPRPRSRPGSYASCGPRRCLPWPGPCWASTTRPTVAPELAQQGLTAQALQPLHNALAAFRTAQPAPRQTIDQRTLANAAATTQLDHLLDEVRELDQDMKAFKLLNPALYAAYLQARKIINSGGGSKAADTPVV